MKPQQGTLYQNFPSFLRTSSNPPPPDFSPPKKTPSNHSPGGSGTSRLQRADGIYNVPTVSTMSRPRLLGADRVYLGK